MLPTHREMLARLVGTPSVSSADPRFDQSNRGVVDLVGEWAEAAGFRVEVREVPDVAGKVNLVATRGEGGDGLVLSGHTDTVPFNAERWTDDPFSLTERDGKLHGLGAADMKGFFAAALVAAARVPTSELQRPIVLLGTADEESTMAGARALADRGDSLGRYAIIGEPTGLTPIHKHKGVFNVVVTVGGQAGHASDPGKGVNAIEGVHRVVQELLLLRDRLATEYDDPDFDVAGPTLSLGRIEGGDSFNRIPDHCALYVDMRLLPGMQPDDVLGRLRSSAQSALDGGNWSFEVRAAGHYDAFGGPRDAEFQGTVETLCGCSARAALFGTEAPYLARLGLETLVLGAGDIGVAHQPDEYVTMAEIERATDLYEQLIRRYCTDTP
ncbi:MAG: acetylornithine deacetylase [Myxococcota bacterium]